MSGGTTHSGQAPDGLLGSLLACFTEVQGWRSTPEPVTSNHIHSPSAATVGWLCTSSASAASRPRLCDINHDVIIHRPALSAYLVPACCRLEQLHQLIIAAHGCAVRMPAASWSSSGRTTRSKSGRRRHETQRLLQPAAAHAVVQRGHGLQPRHALPAAYGTLTPSL